MADLHVSRINKQQKLYGALNQAEDRAVLVDGDLTTAAAAKAAIQVDARKLHVAEAARIERQSCAGIDNAEEFLASYNSGTDVSDFDVLPSSVQYMGQQLVD